jgi:hypothetical protein
MNALMNQPRFVEDELQDLRNIVENARTPAAKHAVIWSAHYRTALRQLANAKIVITSYELLCREPETELRRILDSVGANWAPHVLRMALRPSGTTHRTSAIITGKDNVERWRTTMTQKDVEAVLMVVRQFGMDRVYGDSAMPSDASLQRIRANKCDGLLS